MNNEKFNEIIKLKNAEYKNKFGYIPTINEFLCSREQFIEAIERAIETGLDIESFIPKYIETFDEDVET